MIYLDYAAATPVSPKALKAMEPYFAAQFFNPSAPYLAAKQVRTAYEAAKSGLAHCIGAKGADLVITAGATESINLAFTVLGSSHLGLGQDASSSSLGRVRPTGSTEAKLAHDDGPSERPGDEAALVLVLSTEHPAVRATATQYPHQEIAVDRTGLIDLQDLQAKLTDTVELVSISLANNELGTIQPLAEVAEIIRAERARRLARGIKTPLYLHSDASQALSLMDLNVARLGVDLLTLNAAKVYGPKGIGALYVAHGVELQPITRGGGQEMGLRAGTENVPAMIGFAAAAVEAQKHLAANRQKYTELTDILRAELAKASVSPLFLGHKKHQLANFCPVSFPGLDAERLIFQLEDQEIYLSTGAACAAAKGQKSHVLTAIGLSDAEIAGSLRISLGALNTAADVRQAARAIVQVVNAEYERIHG